MKKQLFRGVGTALVTPFTPQGMLDISMLEKLIIRQRDNGADAIVLCGTTGESATLSDAEKALVFRTGVRLCHKKIPVIAGVGSNDTQHTIRLASMAARCGADGLLVVTPYYNKTSQKGAYQHFEAVAGATRLPILLYNVPSRTGMDLSAETVCRLSKLPTVVGLKEACGNMEKVARILSGSAEDFYVYSGNDSETLPIMALGGCGVISVTSNLLPNVVHSLCQECEAGRWMTAQKLQQKLMPLNSLLFEQVNPIPVKALMECIGMPCGNCRLPLEQLTESAKQKLQRRGTVLLSKFETENRSHCVD